MAPESFVQRKAAICHSIVKAEIWKVSAFSPKTANKKHILRRRRNWAEGLQYFQSISAKKASGIHQNATTLSSRPPRKKTHCHVLKVVVQCLSTWVLLLRLKSGHVAAENRPTKCPLVFSAVSRLQWRAWALCWGELRTRDPLPFDRCQISCSAGKHQPLAGDMRGRGVSRLHTSSSDDVEEAKNSPSNAKNRANKKCVRETISMRTDPIVGIPPALEAVRGRTTANRSSSILSWGIDLGEAAASRDWRLNNWAFRWCC